MTSQRVVGLVATAVFLLSGATASADLGPPRTCNLDGKGCQPCAVSAGKEDAVCAAQKADAGLVMTCESGGASNGQRFYCPRNTTENAKPEETGCAASGRGIRSDGGWFAVGALVVGTLATFRRRRRRV